MLTLSLRLLDDTARSNAWLAFVMGVACNFLQLKTSCCHTSSSFDNSNLIIQTRCVGPQQAQQLTHEEEVWQRLLVAQAGLEVSGNPFRNHAAQLPSTLDVALIPQLKKAKSSWSRMRKCSHCGCCSC